MKTSIVKPSNVSIYVGGKLIGDCVSVSLPIIKRRLPRKMKKAQRKQWRNPGFKAVRWSGIGVWEYDRSQG